MPRDPDALASKTSEIPGPSAPVRKAQAPLRQASEAGTVAAQRFTWEGLVGGRTFITVRVNWLMGEQDLEPAWSFGPEGERSFGGNRGCRYNYGLDDKKAFYTEALSQNCSIHMSF